MRHVRAQFHVPGLHGGGDACHGGACYGGASWWAALALVAADVATALAECSTLRPCGLDVEAAARLVSALESRQETATEVLPAALAAWALVPQIATAVRPALAPAVPEAPRAPPAVVAVPQPAVIALSFVTEAPCRLAAGIAVLARSAPALAVPWETGGETVLAVAARIRPEVAASWLDAAVAAAVQDIATRTLPVVESPHLEATALLQPAAAA